MPIFTHPVTKKETTIPESIVLDDDKKLDFVGEKESGWSVGGWYQNTDGKKFMVKFGDAICYTEKLLTDLARICIGSENVAEKSQIGHGVIEGKLRPCFVISQIEGYEDLAKIKGADEPSSIALRKPYAPKFHRFYTFNALIANDDLHEENLGLAAERSNPFVIDYGLTPTFLYSSQIADAATPFHLASFIGHRNLNSMQLVRRRHFGHDDFLNPDDRLKPQKEKLKPEDINYLSVLDGAREVIKKKDEVIRLAAANLETALRDKSLSDEEKKLYAERYSKFSELLGQRIEWMAENFGTDLALLDDESERKKFAAVKWRLHPKFAELMQLEEEIFKQCAQKSSDKNFEKLSELLSGRSREEILKLDLRTVEKSDLRKFADENFLLHDAMISGDFEMAKWLSKNEICDINQCRKIRTHNYQLFRTTPLHAAIAIYHDKLFYQKTSELEPLKDLIDALRIKFFEKNGTAFDPRRKTEYEQQGLDPFAIQMTFTANQKYQQIASEEAMAATKIQRGFRTHQVSNLAAKEGGRV